VLYQTALTGAEEARDGAETAQGLAEEAAGVSVSAKNAILENADFIAVAASLDNIATVAGIATDIAIVAGGIADIDKVEDIASEITTVAGIKDEIVAVSAKTVELSGVYAKLAEIEAVYGKSTEIDALYAQLDTIAEKANTVSPTFDASDSPVVITNTGTGNSLEAPNFSVDADGEITSPTVTALSANQLLYADALLQRQMQVQYDFVPLHPSRITQLAGLDSAKTMYIRSSAGQFNMIWTNASGRVWTFPAGTVEYGTSTEILTSTDESPNVTIPTGGGVVTLTSDSWSGAYAFTSGTTNSRLQMSIADLPNITLDCSLAYGQTTGDLANVPPVSRILNTTGNVLITGSLPIPTSTTFRAYKITLSGCTGIDVADSIVNMASYWNGKTATTGAYLNMGTLQAEYDVTTEVAQLVSAGFTVTYTAF
jgi:hypothetical protein